MPDTPRGAGSTAGGVAAPVEAGDGATAVGAAASEGSASTESLVPRVYQRELLELAKSRNVRGGPRLCPAAPAASAAPRSSSPRSLHALARPPTRSFFLPSPPRSSLFWTLGPARR